MADGSTPDESQTHVLDAPSRLRAMFDSAIDFAIVVTDLNGLVTDWNLGAEHILGWTAREMVGQSAHRLFTPEDRQAARPEQEMRQSVLAGRATDERWHLRQDGTSVWASGEMMPLRSAGDRHVGYLKIMRDRTEQRLAAEAQRADAEFLRGVLAASGDCIAVLDLDSRLSFMSEGGKRVMEVRDFAALYGRPWLDLWHGQAKEEAQAAIQTAKAGGIGHFWGMAETMAGNPRHWNVQVTPMMGLHGTPERLLVVSRDTTEQVIAETAVRENDAYIRLLLESTAEGFYAIDREGRTTMSNPAFREMLGIANEAEIMGKRLHDLVHHSHPDGSHYPARACPIYRCARYGDAAHVNGENFFKLDGTPVPVEYWAHPIIANGILQGAICTFRDVTDRARAEGALRESEARFRHMADSAPALIWMTDEHGQWSFANMHFDHLFGRPSTDFVNGAWRDVVVAEDLSGFETRFAQAFDARAAFRTEVRVTDIMSALRWLRCEGVPRYDDAGRFLGYTCCTVDVSEARTAAEEMERHVQVRTTELSAALDQLHAEILDRERAEAQLRQSQKMEAVGQLTGGIAHDFNNLLTGVTGSLELLRTRVAQGRLDTLDRYLAAAQGACNRAASLTHRLLAYSRQQTLAPLPTDANALASGMEDMIRRTVGPAIRLETSYTPDLWTTLCDPHQLENALLNLCINARDAMPDGGRLVVETLNARLDEAIAAERDMIPGDYVEIRVSDSGVGMPPDIVARAFEPFFTTKPIGRGTGLGLSMIYGFARQSGGQVRIHSSVGLGTTMRIYLPKAQGGAEIRPLSEPHEAAGRAGAGETVLVVDDEPTIRMLVADVLGDLGYSIIEAADGPQGMDVLRSGARIDLLVTDVGLPGGMNGRQVADAGRRLRPGLKVLFITGYAEGAVLGDGHMETGMHVLTKPFVMEELGHRIRNIIEAGR